MIRELMKSQGWLLTLVAAGGLAGYVLCLFVPGQKAISALRKELDEKHRFVLAANVQASAIPQLERDLSHTRDFVERWRKSSPADPNLVELLGQLAMLANQSGVRVNRLSPFEGVSMAALRQHPLKIEVEGSYRELVSFLGHIESLPATIWTRTLQMRPSQNGPNVQCELMLIVFADNRDISG